VADSKRRKRDGHPEGERDRKEIVKIGWKANEEKPKSTNMSGALDSQKC